MQKLPLQKYARMSNIDMPQNGDYLIQMLRWQWQYETRVCFQNREPNT